MKTISSRQAGIILCVMLLANKILLLPSVLYEYAKADSVFILVLLLLAEIGMVFVFFQLKRKHPNASFYSIIQTQMGVFFAKILYFFIFLYILYKILLVYNVCYMYFRVQVYLDASFYIFVFVFLIVCNSTVLRGLRPLARCMEFFFYFLTACFIFCLMISIANFNKFPLFFDTNVIKFFEGGFKHLFCFGDTLILFLIMEKIKLDKKGEKQISKYAIAISILIVALYVLFYGIFNHISFVHKNAISDIITFSYRFTDIGRLDMVAIVFVMFLSLFQISVALYIFCDIFKKIFNTPKDIYGLISFDLIFIGIVITASLDYAKTIAIGTVIVPYFAIFLQYLLPIICLILSGVRRREYNEKNS